MERTHIKIMSLSVLVGISIFFNCYEIFNFRYFLMNDEGVFDRFTYLFHRNTFFKLLNGFVFSVFNIV